jgi:exosortase/archaeosortase family protein
VGLDWLGAYEFLEIMVTNNATWLMEIIWGVKDYETNLVERVDQDPLSNELVYFGEPYFPGLEDLGQYPRKLLIIRACTGMEAGALIMALIFITPAKWQNKSIAHIVNLLMMHIGNTFRVAFHFWYTEHLYVKYINDPNNTMSIFEAADKAFSIAHDSLSKVFGFIGIVIFTLVINKVGVDIISTFGAWIDALADFFKRATGRIEKRSYYEEKQIPYEELATAEEEPARVVEVNKKFFYPRNEINKNKWNFFSKSFGTFVLIGIGIVTLGLIPIFNQGIGMVTDSLATRFGAILGTSGFPIDPTETNPLKILFNKTFWSSNFINTSINFKITMASSGLLLFAIAIGSIIVTPAKWRNKSIALTITPFLIFPLSILRTGIHKFAVWSVANNYNLKSGRPLLYLNIAEFFANWYQFTLFSWIAIFALIMFIYRKLQVKTFSTIWSWLHQIAFTIGWLIGLSDKPGKDEIFDQKQISGSK